MASEPFVNKVEASGIIAFDLLDYRPEVEIVGFDIKQLLYMEMIIKEKEFRTALAAIDFAVYAGKAVAIYCSVDTIIPSWVYMVLAVKLHDCAVHFDFKDEATLELDLWRSRVEAVDLAPFQDQKVVVRARPQIPPTLYLLATDRLKPLVKTLMYGEIGMPKVIAK